MSHLPVHKLKGNIIQTLENACPDYSIELNHEIKFKGPNGLKGAIIYDDQKRPISDIAQIKDHQITVYENFIAFLWCISYTIVTFYIERDGDIDPKTNLKIQNTISLLNYGYSLKQTWNEWPSSLPDPTKGDNDPCVGFANAITSFAMSYILAHEIGHHTLEHNLTNVGLDTNEAKEDEFNADKYALDVLTAGYEEGDDAKNYSINVAIIVGLGSMLLLEDSWEGGEYYPDSNDRLKKIILSIEELNNNTEEYWKWGLLILFLWNTIYRHENFNPIEHISAKAAFEELEDYLKQKQQYR